MWIVDLRHRVPGARRKPEGDAYTEVSTHPLNAMIGLALMPEITVPLAAIFG